MHTLGAIFEERGGEWYSGSLDKLTSINATRLFGDIGSETE